MKKIVLLLSFFSVCIFTQVISNKPSLIFKKNNFISNAPWGYPYLNGPPILPGFKFILWMNDSEFIADGKRGLYSINLNKNSVNKIATIDLDTFLIDMAYNSSNKSIIFSVIMNEFNKNINLNPRPYEEYPFSSRIYYLPNYQQDDTAIIIEEKYKQIFYNLDWVNDSIIIYRCVDYLNRKKDYIFDLTEIKNIYNKNEKLFDYFIKTSTRNDTLFIWSDSVIDNINYYNYMSMKYSKFNKFYWNSDICKISMYRPLPSREDEIFTYLDIGEKENLLFINLNNGKKDNIDLSKYKIPVHDYLISNNDSLIYIIYHKMKKNWLTQKISWDLNIYSLDMYKEIKHIIDSIK